MESDVYIVKVDLYEGFEAEVSAIAKVQAARDNPRKLVSVFVLIDQLVLVFELV